MIKLIIAYVIWQIVKLIAGIKAIAFFLAIAKKTNATQGGIANSKIINGLVTPT